MFWVKILCAQSFVNLSAGGSPPLVCCILHNPICRHLSVLLPSMIIQRIKHTIVKTTAMSDLLLLGKGQCE